MPDPLPHSFTARTRHQQPRKPASRRLQPRACAAQSIEAKAPFSQYAALADGANPLTVAYGAPADPASYPEGAFDVVVDNNGKSMAECQPLIDHYASQVRSAVPRPPCCRCRFLSRVQRLIATAVLLLL
jgi:hypothetical protein